MGELVLNKIKDYLKWCAVIFFIGIIIHSPANADCFSVAAKRYSVPVDILKAIAFVESNNHAFALNVGGIPYFAKGFFEAERSISDNLSRSFDIGVMQVNRWWFDKFNYPYIWGFNSCWNIHFGAYILNYELNRAKGDIWQAVGRYHSPTISNQKKYIERVIRIWQQGVPE